MTIAPGQNELGTPETAHREDESGLALLAVLWIIASGTLLVAAFNMNVRSGLSFVRSEVQLSQADALIDAGLEIAATRIVDQEPSRRWLPDGIWRTVTFAGTSIRIRIQDPNGLLDLNKADEKLLLDFFKTFAANANEAKMITDRIVVARGETPGAKHADTDADTTKRNAPSSHFVDVGQLRQIEGMSIALFRRVAPFMTVFNVDGIVNPLTSPDEVYNILSKDLGADAQIRREAFKAGRKLKNPDNTDGGERAPNEFGPAFAVTVEVLGGTGKGSTVGKTFVIAIGLDATLPYRLVSARPASAQY